MATTKNILLYQGDDFVWTEVTDEIEIGDVATGQMRRWPGGPLIAEFECTVSIVGPISYADFATMGYGLWDQQAYVEEVREIVKTLTIRMSAITTRHIKRGGSYDIQLSGPSGVRTLFAGSVGLRSEVTTPIIGYVDATTYKAFADMDGAAWANERYLDMSGVN